MPVDSSRPNGPGQSTGGLAALLRELRRETGQGIKAAGPELGVNYTYLSKLENGKVMPSSDLLLRIAEHYDVSPDPLFLAAGRLPPDVEDIISRHPEEAVALLRTSFRP